MEIIDFHAHIYPKKIADRAVEGIGRFYNIEMSSEGTTEKLIEIGENAGIEKYLVHSVATSPDHVERINDFINEECTKHSCFCGFGTMHQNYEDKLAEAERIISSGLKGIKIHPDTQGFNMDDPCMYELYDFMQERLALLVHCGDYRYNYSHPARLAKLIKNFPKLTIIGAHFGGWSLQDLALEYLRNKNCYLDTSSSIMYLGKTRAKELIQIYGAERIVFGSDYPMWNPSDEIKRIMEIGLSDKEYELILNKNASRILSI